MKFTFGEEFSSDLPYLVWPSAYYKDDAVILCVTFQYAHEQQIVRAASENPSLYKDK